MKISSTLAVLLCTLAVLPIYTHASFWSKKKASKTDKTSGKVSSAPNLQTNGGNGGGNSQQLKAQTAPSVMVTSVDAATMSGRSIPLLDPFRPVMALDQDDSQPVKNERPPPGKVEGKAIDPTCASTVNDFGQKINALATNAPGTSGLMTLPGSGSFNWAQTAAYAEQVPNGALSKCAKAGWMAIVLGTVGAEVQKTPRRSYLLKLVQMFLQPLQKSGATYPPLLAAQKTKLGLYKTLVSSVPQQCANDEPWCFEWLFYSMTRDEQIGDLLVTDTMPGSTLIKDIYKAWAMVVMGSTQTSTIVSAVSTSIDFVS